MRDSKHTIYAPALVSFRDFRLIVGCRSTGAAFLMLSYGYSVKSDDDELVNIAEDAMLGFGKASEPGAFLVDRFPSCALYYFLFLIYGLEKTYTFAVQYIPAWFPGAGFKRLAREWREGLDRLYDVPFNFVLSGMVSEQFSPRV